jgi:hypothetical protein
MSATRGRPFEPGNTFGPGRPKGSRNRTAALAQQLLEEYAGGIMKKCIHDAMEGDPVCMRLCVDRILSPLRDSLVSIKLPKVEDAKQLPKVVSEICRLTGRGELTPQEAQSLASVLTVLKDNLPLEQLPPKADLPDWLLEGLCKAQEPTDEPADAKPEQRPS